MTLDGNNSSHSERLVKCQPYVLSARINFGKKKKQLTRAKHSAAI